MPAAKPKAMVRGFERATGPTSHEPVMNSTALRSDVKASWARLTRAIDTPNVSNSDDSSGASMTRNTRVRWRTTPSKNRSAIEIGSDRYGLRPNRAHRNQVVYAPSISSGPWAMLMTRMTPKISARPSATMAYRAPARIPDTRTWASMAGVTATLMDGSRRTKAQGAKGGTSDGDNPGRGRERPPPRGAPVDGLPLVPGRRREAQLPAGQLVGPDGHLLPVLPLEEHHLVRDLESVLVDLVVPEHGPHLELEQLVAHAVGVERSGALDGLAVREEAGISGRRMVGGLAAELLLVGLQELLLSGVRQHRLPLGGPVDVLGVLLEQLVELGKVAAHGHAEH